jgi:hypothetical protein
MPRRPMIIFDETVVAGTVLLLIPFLKSTTLSPFSENNREPGRTRQLKWFFTIAGEI